MTLVDRVQPDNPEGFPWGLNEPQPAQRYAVAVAVATFAAGLLRLSYFLDPHFHSDFEQVWFGASALLHGGNPYELVGPNSVFYWPWRLYYPATSLVAALPFTFFSAENASIAFVWLSTLALAYGITSGSWHRLPLFASASFVYSARLAQWSIPMTAAVFVPILAFLVIAKPQSGLPVLVSARDRLTWKAAAIGGVVLLGATFSLLPGWLGSWLEAVRHAPHITPPVTWLGGPAILLVILRWRRPEAWLVLSMACLPQTSGWYNALMLLAIPHTYREACILSLVSTAGVMLTNVFTSPFATVEAADNINRAVMVACCYLPATIAILRHPNDGDMPAWMQFVCDRARKGSAYAGNRSSSKSVR